jgi:hypothetical protein
MKASLKTLLAASLFLAPAAFATKVPIPIEGATLNVSFQLQTEALINQAANPAGTDPTYDIFVRRSRLLINGDVNQNFSYLLQIDNANFGKYGNFTGRALVQDAWFGWAPTGITGGTVVYIDAGILLIPISHHLLMSTTNFITADVQTDAWRIPGSPFPGFRDTGIQLRGWAFDKKIGFRGGVYEGFTPFTQGTSSSCISTTATTTTNGCITPKRNPALGGFVNVNIIGSEEGGWLYGAYKWGKDPILSVGLAGNYQSLALKNPYGSLTDQKLLAVDAYLNFPMTEQAELVGEGTVYINGNGTDSATTGTGVSASLGYRFGFIAPYVAYDYFQWSGDCSDGAISGLFPTASPAGLAAQKTACLGAADSVNSRNIKAGLNFFVNKNLNHINLEFQANHGFSAFGPASVTTASAGYVPLSLDPITTGGPRRPFNSNLRNPAFWSILAHWNVIF